MLPEKQTSSPNESTSHLTGYQWILIAIFIIFIVILIIYILNIANSLINKGEETEFVNPVSIFEMTPMWQKIATFDAVSMNAGAFATEVSIAISDLSDNKISEDAYRATMVNLELQLDKQVNNLQSTVNADIQSLQETTNAMQASQTALLVSSPFATEVSKIQLTAASNFTATQRAIECLVTPLAQYETVSIRQFPNINSFIVENVIFRRGQTYTATKRTNAEYNSLDLWWYVVFDSRNNLTGWINSTWVSEQTEVTCMQLVIAE